MNYRGTNLFKHALLGTLLGLASCMVLAAEPPAAPIAATSLLRSELDGWLDFSGFIDQAYGFLPIVIPITEPAVGFGAVGAMAFIDRQPPQADTGLDRPNISLLGGLATENGTRGAFVADMRHWLDGKAQTLAGAIKTSINLDYYGTGEQGFLHRNPQSYMLDISGAMAQGRYRIGSSPNWLGLGYFLANTEVAFNTSAALAVTPQPMRLAGVLAAITHDTRDNLFTPRSGNFVELSSATLDHSVGSDIDFTRLNLLGMQYLPFASNWYLGLRESITHNIGDAPFYLQPFVYMRGVPAMRYQGETVAQAEAELRWQLWQRFSLVGFGGIGAAEDQIRSFSRQREVSAGGIGMRYELARKYGVHAGFDVAWGRDGPAVYVQFGSAWMRP